MKQQGFVLSASRGTANPTTAHVTEDYGSGTPTCHPVSFGIPSFCRWP